MTDRAASGPKLTWTTRILFGFGSAANGVKFRVLSVLLLIFYNQVLHLPATLVASVIAAVTAWGGILDPVIGQVSDNLRSKLGRRHPFMYISALPMAVGFFFLFNPPAGLGQGGLLLFLLVSLIGLRIFDTFYDLAAAALVPELAPNYHDRTVLIGIRQGFSLAAGFLSMMAAYQVFMKVHPDGSGGITSREGYLPFSLFCATLIFVSIMTATIATHRYIKSLEAAPARKMTLRAIVQEMGRTINNRSFVAFTIGGLFTSLAIGLRGALDIYFNLYFWGVSQAQLAGLVALSLPVSVAAALLAPIIGRVVEKKLAAICAYAGTMVVTLGPIALRSMGLLPPNGDPAIVTIVYAETLLGHFMLVSAAVFTLSMLADIAEDVAIKSGRRSEGLLYAAETMLKKVSSGAGIFIAGLLLDAVHFPKNAKHAGVGQDVLHQLGLLYIPVAGIMFLLGMLTLTFYSINKRKHEANLAALAGRQKTKDMERDAALTKDEGASPAGVAAQP